MVGHLTSSSGENRVDSKGKIVLVQIIDNHDKSKKTEIENKKKKEKRKEKKPKRDIKTIYSCRPSYKNKILCSPDPKRSGEEMQIVNDNNSEWFNH